MKFPHTVGNFCMRAFFLANIMIFVFLCCCFVCLFLLTLYFFCTCVDVIVLSLFASIIAKCHFMNVRAECPKSFLLQLFAASNGVECGLFPCVLYQFAYGKAVNAVFLAVYGVAVGRILRCEMPCFALRKDTFCTAMFFISLHTLRFV